MIYVNKCVITNKHVYILEFICFQDNQLCIKHIFFVFNNDSIVQLLNHKIQLLNHLLNLTNSYRILSDIFYQLFRFNQSLFSRYIK